MFLHLGQDFVVSARDVVGIFDIESATIAWKTRDFLKKAQRERRVIAPADELPKSFVVCSGRAGPMVYLSVLSPATLRGRLSYFDTLKKSKAIFRRGR